MQRGKVKIIIGIIAAVLLLGWGALYVAAHYPQWRAEQQVRRTADELKRIEEDDYQRAMADTYGGKTPQETLALFIEAVEGGDYELASKYFIGEKRERELNALMRSEKENIFAVTELLKKIGEGDGNYTFDDEEYVVNEPIYVRFKLYPNGVWKIIEI